MVKVATCTSISIESLIIFISLSHDIICGYESVISPFQIYYFRLIVLVNQFLFLLRCKLQESPDRISFEIEMIFFHAVNTSTMYMYMYSYAYFIHSP